jgi:hypothetical protein
LEQEAILILANDEDNRAATDTINTLLFKELRAASAWQNARGFQTQAKSACPPSFKVLSPLQ